MSVKNKILCLLFSVFLLGGCFRSNQPVENKIQLGRVEYSGHGDKSFTIASVAIGNDVVIDAYIDEYLFIENTNQAIPNAQIVGSFWNEGKVLASKRVNASEYSKSMKEKASATLSIDDNFNRIQDYVKNKSITELEELVKKDSSEVLDTVTSATLIDTKVYIQAILEAARQAKNSPQISYNGDINQLELKQSESAVTDAASFMITTVLMDDKKIIDTYIDEYEYMVTENITPVPNSENMNENLMDPGISLGSKRMNSQFYSANMKQFGNATQTIIENYEGIRNYVRGKNVDEISRLSDKSTQEILDTVTGSTLTGIQDYLKSIVLAAENPK